MQAVDGDPAFLELIRADPASDELRLIYADHLDGSAHEPQRAQADLIRLQLALPQLRPTSWHYQRLLNQQKELLLKFHASWTAPLRGLVAGFEFRRGLLESICLDTGVFLEHGTRILQHAPIQRIRFMGVGERIRDLARCPTLLHVPELDFCGADLGTMGLEQLLQSPYLRQLRHLDVSFNGLCPASWGILAASASMPVLRSLALNDNQTLTHAGMEQFVASPYYEHLEELDLSGNSLDARAIMALASPTGLPGLQSLRIHSNPLGDDGVAVLAQSTLLPRALLPQGRLDLRMVQFSATGLLALLRATALRKVIEWDLTANMIGDDGLLALMDSGQLQQLSHLNLRQNGLTDRSGMLLARSALMKQLDYLDLSSNLLTWRSLERLWKYRKNFQTVLEVSGNLDRLPNT